MTASATVDGSAILETALSYRAVWLSVIPILRDGSKRPACKWEGYQRRFAPENVIQHWFGRHEYGIAIVAGAISGHLEMIDFDAADLFEPWSELVEAQAPGLMNRLTLVKTPRPGYQLVYRCPSVTIPGNDKLAEEPCINPKTGKPGRKTLIETRGQGGYFLTVGCPPNCHPTGRVYEHIAGPPLTELAEVTAQEREIMISVARSFDRMRPQEKPSKAKPGTNGRANGSDDGLRPGDDFNARGPGWDELLVPHAWGIGKQRSQGANWKRPGKDEAGCSATTGFCRNEKGEELFYNFSSNAYPFEANKAYSKFAVYAILNHGGDFSAAAKQLAKEGYGDQRPKQRRARFSANGHAAPSVNGTGEIHQPAQPGQLRGPQALERDDDPHRLARLVIKDNLVEGGVSLRYYQEEYHRSDGSAYQRVDTKQIRGEVVARVKREMDELAAAKLAEYEHFNQKRSESGESEKEGKKKEPPKARTVTCELVSNVLQALVSETMLASDVAPPCWIDHPRCVEPDDFAPPFPAGEVLACKNTLVHLPSLVEGRECLHPLTPRFFTVNSLAFAFDPQAPDPTQWLEFLGRIWPNDPQAIDTLQEWFGYSLLPNTAQQKVLFILGPRRSGKGTIARVLERLVGMRNAAAPTLASLGMNFGLWPLVGKTLAVISDARLSRRSDVAVVVERLLSISGEDLQTIDRKCLSSITVKLPTRFVILSNELPKLTDASGALVSRLVVLRQTRSWLGREDTTLTDRLLTELPGILLWAIDGWQRLRERGHFVQPESSVKVVQDLEDLTSPISAFIRECCVLGTEYEVLVSDLFAEWRRWCETKGRKDPGTEQGFGKDLRAALPSLDMRQARGGGGRVRVYIGVGVRQLEDEDSDSGAFMRD